MSEYKAIIRWTHSKGDFIKGTYSREHTWTFDGGVTVPASPSPSVVPAPYSNKANVDPEEAFVAAIPSCHMLTYLYVAQRKGIEIASYEDEAVGRMTKSEKGGTLWISAVVLHPIVRYSGEKIPSREEETDLHHAAHAGCYIANSVKTDIVVEFAP